MALPVSYELRMKILTTISFIFISILLYGQKVSVTIGGEYSYGDDIEKGRSGNLTVYEVNDSVLLFYFDLNRGGPTYHMGTLYGRAMRDENENIFKFKSVEFPCNLKFFFSEKSVTVKSETGEDTCGFGYAVFADGEFERSSFVNPRSFVNGEGLTIEFSKTTPEKYNEY